MEILKQFISKITSGRFICLLGIVFTYCYIINKSINLLVQQKIEKDIVVGLVVGFASLASNIITAYFERRDRKTEEK